jgi:hypothetical protein
VCALAAEPGLRAGRNGRYPAQSVKAIGGRFRKSVQNERPAERFQDRCVEAVFSEGSPGIHIGSRAAVGSHEAAAWLQAARKPRAHCLQFLSVVRVIQKTGHEDQIERLLEGQLLAVADGVIDPERLDYSCE